MKRKIVSELTLTLLLISMSTLVFNIQPAKAEPTTIVVPDDYEKIQWAIGNVSDGDTIFVRAGTYYEHVVVNKIISLIGQNKSTTIIDGNGTSNVVYISAENTCITGFTLQNGGWDGGAGHSGIHIVSNNNNISNNIISSNNNHGLYLRNANNNTISNNIISQNRWCGIVLRNSDYNIILNNNVIENRKNNNGHGIHLADSHFNIIEENYITKNDGGIGLTDGSGGNEIKHNRIFSDFHDGIFMYTCNGVTNKIELNEITYSGGGIHLLDSDGHIIIRNNISHNSYGGIGFQHTVHACSQNIFYHNNLVENTPQVWYFSSNNTWDNGYPSGGNYWSDYTGVDLYSGPYQNETGSDGIGDTPYSVDEDNRDKYPLMEPWSLKPSSPVEATQELIETIETWELPKGTENSLKAKLKVTIHMLDIGKEDGAIHKLTAFINRVEMLREKMLTNEQADELVSEAQKIIDLING